MKTYPGGSFLLFLRHILKAHSALLGMEQADDQAVWAYAKQNGFVIVTRDSDYLDLSALHGQPPKIVWLRTGNQSKAAVIHLLLKSKDAIEKSLEEEDKACIEIY
jgi:predicted nuclease of predicted toxin-antitoxin system